MIIDQKPQAHWLLGAALVLLVPGLQYLETSPGGKVINVIMIIQVGSGDRASASLWLDHNLAVSSRAHERLC